MKITDVHVTVFHRAMPPLHGALWSGQQEVSRVEVVTDEGTVGYGSARAQGGSGGRAIADPILTVAAPRAIGQDSLNRERIWRRRSTCCWKSTTGPVGMVHAPMVAL